jgi:hypothetical protein
LSRFHKGTLNLDEIIEKIDVVLQLPVYLVIFTDKILVDKINEKRNSTYGMDHLTKIIELEFEDLWVYPYVEKIRQNREKKWDTRDERTCSESHAITCNKMDFVLQVIDSNPFKTSKFAWLDAYLGANGKMRICEDYSIDKFLYNLSKISDKFHIQILNVCDKKYKNKELIDEFYTQYRYIVCGGFFTCGKEIGIKILNRLKEIFIDTTERGYGHGEEPLYLEILDEFYDEIARGYGDYGQMINNIIEPTRNYHYIYHLILNRYLQFGYYRECYDCATVLLKQIETHQADVGWDIYMKILFDYYISSYYYKPDKCLTIANNIYEICEKNPYMKSEFDKNHGFYISQLKFANMFKEKHRLIVCVFACSTIPKYREELLKIEETWGKNVKVVYFLGEDETDLQDPEKFIYLKGVKNDYLSASDKQNLGLKYIYENFDADFVFVCGTDTYIRVEKMMELIDQYSCDKPLYIGGHGDERTIGDQTIYFHSGGAGFLLSKEALHLIYRKLWNMTSIWSNILLQNNSKYLTTVSCDVAISYFLQNELDANVQIIKFNEYFYACNYKGLCHNNTFTCCGENVDMNKFITCHHMTLQDFDDLYAIQNK